MIALRVQWRDQLEFEKKRRQLVGGGWRRDCRATAALNPGSGLVVCDTETEGKENVDLCRIQSLSVKERTNHAARLTPSMTALMRVPVPDLSSRLRPDAADCEDL
jgi:hypothetical protein